MAPRRVCSTARWRRRSVSHGSVRSGNPCCTCELPLLAVRSLSSGVVSDADWLRYGKLFPTAQLVEFDDSPHDIFRPDRGRYPRLIHNHVDRAEGLDRGSPTAADG